MTVHSAFDPRPVDPATQGIIKLALLAVGGQGGGVLTGWIEDVARSQGKRTIAEWIESEAAMACLRGIGVDAGQGYAIHKPEPLRELIETFRLPRSSAAQALAEYAQP